MDAKRDLMGTSSFVAARSLSRLEGVTEEELVWEPVSPCWSLRRRPDGSWHPDNATAPVVPPFTTVGWRLWHLTETYGAPRNERWLTGASAPNGFDHDDPIPATVDAMVDRLRAAQDWWHALLERVDEDDLATPLGEVAGPYAEQTKAAFVLHQLDEQIHHGAEIGVVRDLFRAEHAPPYPRSIVRAVRDGLGERVLEYLADPAIDVDEVDDEYGATALHFASAAGDTVLVTRLLDRGADPTRHDRQFDADAAGWATFFEQREVVELLGARPAS